MADFSDSIPDGSGWWFGGVSSAIAVVLGGVKVYYFFRDKRHAHNNQVENDQNARTRQIKRDAIEEAYEVVDRLQKEIDAQSIEIRKLRESQLTLVQAHAKSEAECAATRATLRIIVAWARKQKNPLPLPDDLLDKLGDSAITAPLDTDPPLVKKPL